MTKRFIRTPLSKYLWAVVLFAAAHAPLSAQAPVAEWKFNEGSGAIAFDSSGNGHNALLSSGIRWVSGISGWAISTNEENRGYVTIPPIDLQDTKAVTVTFWVKRKYTTAGGDVLFEASENYQTSSTSFAFLPDDETCHGIQAVLRGNEGVTANCYSQPSSEVWHHFAIIYDKSQTGGNAVAFYVDGVLQVPSWNLSSSTNTNSFGNDPTYLFSCAGSSQFSSGTVNNLRIYDSALTAAQIQQIYDGTDLGRPAPSGWQQGFDFRNTASFVTDPPGDTDVLATTAYPTTNNGVTYGWTRTPLVQGRDRNAGGDPRLAGINFVNNGSPATFYVNLPSAGTYNLSLAMGDAGYEQCWVQCQIQFLDGSTVLATLTKGLTNENYFYDAHGNNWSAAAWPSSNLSQQVTLAGTQLSVVVGTNHVTGDLTPIAFLGVAQVSGSGTYTLSASPTSVTVQQGNQGTSTIASTLSGGFNNAISLSASGIPAGTTVSFNPQTLPAPGSGNSTMTITVGASTPTGIYPITVTGSGGGIQQNTTVTLTVARGSGGGGWQQGFDFRNTASFVTDPPGDTDVLATTAYPTTNNGVTYGWTRTPLVQGRDRNAGGDPRLAGINFVNNGSPATFYVNLPSAGTYNLSLAMGDAGYEQCWVQCQIQFLDGSTVLATLTKGLTNENYFYDAHGNNWSAAAWPSSNLSQQVTLAGTQLSVVVGTNHVTGDLTPIAFLGVAQVSGSGTYTLSASPTSVTVQQGNQGTSTITTAVSGGFNSAVTLSAAGMPSGTTVSFNPNPIPAPGSGNSTMTITVGSSTPTGTYPITVTGNGGGVQQTTTVTLTVTAPPSFTISASPASLTVVQGNQGTSTITTAVSGGFNSAVTLSAAGMPSGTTVSFNPNPIPAPGSGNSTMTITVGSSTPTGTYPITVTGNGGGVQQTTTVTLTVTAPPSFTISASPASLTVAQGNQGTSNITTAISGGFNSAISLSASGVPTGTTVSFNPATIPAPGSGNSTMTITVGSSTPTGTYPITVTGNGGGVQQTTTVTLTVTAPPSFTITAAPASLTVVQGNQGTSTITTAVSGGFNSAVTLSAAGMPSGTTVSFNPNPIPAPGSGNSTMTITVGSSTPTGTYPITVTGNGGGVQQTTTVTLTVTAPPSFTITAAPASLTVVQGNQGTSTITTAVSGGFNSAVTLSAAGMPSGTTVSFNPNPIPAPGSGNSTMTITVGSSTPTGTYPITVTGNGGGVQQTTTVTLTVTAPPSFTITAAPASLTVVQGNQGTSTITTAVSGGFNSAVTLSAAGMPSGTTVSFNPNPIPAPGSGNSTMTITVGSSTPTGTYPITVTGNGGGVQQTTTVTLTVTAPPSFTITAAPASLTVVQGNQGTSTITTAVSGGFNSAVTLSAAGMPSGTTVSFNPNPIPAPGSGNSTMTITVGSSTPTGTYPITVTGNGGGVQQTTTVTLTVTAPPSFTITAAPASLTVVQGNQGTSTITTAVSGGFNSAVTLSAAGMPSGTTVSFNPNPIPAPGSGNSTMTITVGSSTPTGTYPITVTGNGGGVQQTTTVTLTVTAPPSFTITAAPASLTVVQGNQGTSTITTAVSGGFNSAVTLSAAGMPSGTTVSFNPNPIPAPGSGNSTMTITVGSSTPTGTYPITVTGNGGGVQQTTTVTLTVTAPPSFTITAAPASLTVVQGNQGTSTITTAVSGGFNNSISISASGVPSGATVTFNPTSIPAPGSGNSTMSISVASSTPTGTYPITVTGNGGGVQQSATVTLTVTAAPSFAISASPSSLSVMQESQGISTITVSISNGFNNPVSLSASGMPSGTTVSFNPATIPAPGSGNSTMTITVGATLMGTYPITVTASGGGIYQTVTVNLTVTAQVILSWTASQSPGIAGYNIYRSTTSGGPYTKINSSLDPNTNYNDLAVQDGVTYYYVTTAVNNQGQESAYSNESSATVP